MTPLLTRAAEAFMKGEPLNGNATIIKVINGRVCYYYYGNLIAWRWSNSNCFWVSIPGLPLESILRRLNKLLGVDIKRRHNGQLFLNGKIWDGNEIKINI